MKQTEWKKLLREGKLLHEGYTIYWDEYSFSSKQWRELVDGAEKIVAKNVASEDGLGKPTFSHTKIAFNGQDKSGKSDESGEPFVLYKKGSKDLCKTNRKPYTKSVKKVLALAQEINPKFTWKSDS